MVIEAKIFIKKKCSMERLLMIIYFAVKIQGKFFDNEFFLINLQNGLMSARFLKINKRSYIAKKQLFLHFNFLNTKKMIYNHKEIDAK